LINQYGYELDTFNGLPGVPVPPDTATLGTTEVWSLINTTVDVHPIHLHQTMFKVLSRQPFSVSQYQAKRVHGVPLDPTPFLKQDMLQGPAPNESGWKDTVKANPGEVTRIAMRWEDYTGHYVYHCHILEHEEHDMMRALDVLPAL
jgi:spore coat protein A